MNTAEQEGLNIRLAVLLDYRKYAHNLETVMLFGEYGDLERIAMRGRLCWMFLDKENTIPDFLHDAGACLWAWERVIGRLGDGAFTTITSYKNNGDGGPRRYCAEIQADGEFQAEGYGATEQEARVICLIKTLGALEVISWGYPKR